MLTPASVATSSRRRPGVRRRPLSGDPTSPGCNCSQQARRNSAVVSHITRMPDQPANVLAPVVPGSTRPSPTDRVSGRCGHDSYTYTHRHLATLGPRPLGGRHQPLLNRVHHPPPRRVEGAGPFVTRFEAEVVIGETLDTTTVNVTVDVTVDETANADRDFHTSSRRTSSTSPSVRPWCSARLASPVQAPSIRSTAS